MTLKEKIASIDPDKTKSPVKVREYINKAEAVANDSETKALALIDGLIARLTLDNPDAIKSVTLTTEQAKRNLTKLKTLKAIVPKKADAQQIESQIRKQYPNWDDDKIKKLAQLRIDAQISRAESFNKMIDTLGASEFYGAKELSTAPIDKGRSRNLQKDSKEGAITEADELKMRKRGVKPAKYKRISKAGAKNQYGTTTGGKVYYEYRQNRRDVDSKIRLEQGGNIPNADKMYHLPLEVAVYVPSTKNVSENITASELRSRVKEVEKYLAETFGGFTASEKVGGYLSSKSSVITEKVVPVTSFSTKADFEKNKSKLVNKLSVWAKKWGQEAMGLEFEGDLYYVPQKFKTGGTLRATYIPRTDIKMLTTVWGNNIRGKDLLDGAYTKRKNIKKAPQMSRIMFEEETYEYATGGVIAYSNDDYEQRIGSFSSLGEAKKFAKANKLKYDTITFEDEYGDNIVVTKSDTLKDIDYLFSEEYGKGGGLDGANLEAIKNEYLENEDDNYHSENVVLLAKYFGTATDLKEAKKILTDHDKEGSLTQANSLKRRKLSQKLINKARAKMLEQGIKFKEGGQTPPKPKMVRYFFDDEEQEYAKGGMTQHGLKRGDTIVDDMFWENKIVIRDAEGKMGIVDLETGIRK